MVKSSSQSEDPLRILLKDLVKEAEDGKIREMVEHLRRLEGLLERLRAHLLTRGEELLKGGRPEKEVSTFRGRPGDVLAHYVILSELGHGGQAVVFKAEDTVLHRQVALKVYPYKDLPGWEAFVERFNREARLLAMLDDPGICTVHEAGRVGDCFYIDMQYVPGVTLSSLLRGSRFSSASTFSLTTEVLAEERVVEGDEEEDARRAIPRTPAEIVKAVELVERVARSLHVAHQAGIIHRDIKPGNIMVTPEGRPVILDFGLARGDGDEHPQVTMTGDCLGTRPYMSPEQFASEHQDLDRRTDIHSLGVTLFEMLAGRRPFDEPSLDDLIQSIRFLPPPDIRRLNRAVPRDLKSILEKALAKNRDDRYSTAEDLADDLRRFRRKEPVKARPVPAWVRTWRWAQRNRAVAVCLVLIMVSLMAGLAGSLHYAGQAEEERVRVMRHSDLQLFSTLMDEADRSFWPLGAVRTSSLKEWLQEARELAGRLPTHLAEVERLERGLAGGSGRGTWLIQKQRQDLDEAGRLLGEKTGLPGRVVVESHGLGVGRRLELCTELERRRAAGPDARWRRLTQALAEDARFPSDFELPFLPELVPLGRDEESGFWEFFLLGSGERPGWSGSFEKGHVVPAEKMGIVLILLPGLEKREEASGHHSVVPVQEGRRRSQGLRPFLASKYELTQWQWWWVMGTKPAYYRMGAMFYRYRYTGRHPVENITWLEAHEALRRLGLTFPTRRQWSYAARGGTKTPWWTGDRPESLHGAANVRDLSAKRNWPNQKVQPNLEDGYIFHSPVGVFRANPFGLHDTIGNVNEFCLDSLDSETFGSLPHHKYRGGSFDFLARDCVVNFERALSETMSAENIGVRPVRNLEP